MFTTPPWLHGVRLKHGYNSKSKCELYDTEYRLFFRFWIISIVTDFIKIKKLKITIFSKFCARRPSVRNFTGNTWKPRAPSKSPILKKCHMKTRLDCAKSNLQHDNDYFQKFLWRPYTKMNFLATTMLPMFGEGLEQHTVRKAPSLPWNTIVVTWWFGDILSTVKLKISEL